MQITTDASPSSAIREASRSNEASIHPVMDGLHSALDKSCSTQQKALVRVIGERMRQARELCNMSQLVAAKRLGYKNSSKLSKIEKGTEHRCTISLWVLVRAAQVYEVSVDYLCGLSDDWETGARMTQEREVSAWLFKTWEVARKREMEVLHALHHELSFLAETVQYMLTAVNEVQSALDVFTHRNPNFVDMKASSRLVYAVERANEAAQGANIRMRRFKHSCQIAQRSDLRQMELFSQKAE